MADALNARSVQLLVKQILPSSKLIRNEMASLPR